MTLRELRKYGINQNGLILFIREDLVLYVDYDKYSNYLNKPILYLNGTNTEDLVNNVLIEALKEIKVLGVVIFLLFKECRYMEKFRKKEINPFIDKEINIEYM